MARVKCFQGFLLAAVGLDLAAIPNSVTALSFGRSFPSAGMVAIDRFL
ncbi:MAG: hypothetical protein HC860_10275 [Alkalinema sp. RU_4_3]|nr:hypothetical protein [Alkalinema sp. RU_4_3]